MSLYLYRLGLTGYPLDHSLSPSLHVAALQACALPGEYRLYPVPPEDETGLQELLERMRSEALHGLNVTIPHKRKVLPLLDEVSPTAQAIGAVNTIYVRDGLLRGENTDAAGFLTDLGRVLPVTVPGVALVLGAGGSARAVVYALLQAGWQVCVAARRLEQAQALRQAISTRVEALALDAAMLSRLIEERRVELLVNATPWGWGGRQANRPCRKACGCRGWRSSTTWCTIRRKQLCCRQRGMPAWRAPTGWACWWSRRGWRSSCGPVVRWSGK